MGGFGSGDRRNKKATVESCLQLDVARLTQLEVIRSSTRSRGELAWTNSNGDQILAVRFCLEGPSEDQTVLHFTAKREAGGTETAFVESIQLVSTIPHFGGVRWWFICPLSVKGVSCRRRVRKLYRPRGATYFGCRTCYNLTYKSAQAHDARVGDLMKDPFSLIEAIESKNPHRSLLGLRAYSKLVGLV
jgi:hypothetical protein